MNMGAAGGCVFEEEISKMCKLGECRQKPDALYHDRRTNIQIAWSTLEVRGEAEELRLLSRSPSSNRRQCRR
jgi:hypothetical protein